MDLTPGQLKRLRAEGHRMKLKPVVSVGQKGLSDNLHQEIEQALCRHELVKVKIPGLDRETRRSLGQHICRQHSAQLVEAIGGVIVLYRQNRDTDRFAAIVGG